MSNANDLPTFSIRELLEAGVHFGHKTMRWNPKMAPYLFGSRNNIHIIDLQQTVPMFYRALQAVRDVVANNGRILFVGTKRQASDVIAESAKRCGQYYVNHRWLGGMLTNWNTISGSINVLRALEKQLDDTSVQITKKERLNLDRQREKLECSLGGIRDMGGQPDLLFVVDTNKEALAITEAKKLGIPVVAIVDSNSNPDDIDYPIPGNDDATRAIALYCQLVSDAVLSGIQREMIKGGADVGESAEVPLEVVKGDAKPAAKAEEKKVAPAKKAAPKKEAVKKEAPAKKEKAEEKEAAPKKAAAKKAPAKQDGGEAA